MPSILLHDRDMSSLIDTFLRIAMSKFNLPAYLQIPFFLYQDLTLDRSSLLLSSFFYSLFTAGKSIKVSNEYLSELIGIHLRKVQENLENLENKGYITRVGLGSRRKIIWVYTPSSEIIIEQKEYEGAVNGMVDEKLYNHADNGVDTMPLTAPLPCRQRHPYIKVDNKENNKERDDSPLLQPITFDDYKKAELGILSDLDQQMKNEKSKQEAINNKENIEQFDLKFGNTMLTIGRLYDLAQEKCGKHNRPVGIQGFFKFIRTENSTPYLENTENNLSKSSITPDENKLIQEYVSTCRALKKAAPEMKDQIEKIKIKLKNTNKSWAREAIAAINNAEESLDSTKFVTLMEKAKKHEISAIAKQNLNFLKAIK